MNTKAIRILNQLQDYPVKSITYVLTAGIVLICCSYIASVGSYFLLASAPAAAPPRLNDEVLKQIGTIRDRRLNEISGIAKSSKYKNAFWVHNDSGNPAELYLIKNDATVLAKVVLKGATNRDWEDICQFEVGNQSYVCVGDFGDNRGIRDDYCLYLLKEPQLDLESAQAASKANYEFVTDEFSKLEFSYSDGRKNCEAFAFDTNQHCFLLAEKGFDRKKTSNPGIYRLQMTPDLKPSHHVTATRMADCKVRNATAMALSGNGSRLVIASYAMAVVWDREGNQAWENVLRGTKGNLLPLPVQRQGEAITLNDTGNLAFVTSEFTNQPLWQIQVESVIQMAKSNSNPSDRN